MTPTERFITLEPNWAGLRRWAASGLAVAIHDEDIPAIKTMRAVLAECEKAKAAGRPDTNWEDI